MNTIKNLRISEWLKAQKTPYESYKSDIDLDIITLNEINFEKNPIVYGCIREKGAEFFNRQRVFYGWMDVLYYYKLNNLYFHEDGEIHGDITVYEVTDNTIKELKKGIN